VRYLIANVSPKLAEAEMTDLSQQLLTAIRITQSASKVANSHFRNLSEFATKTDDSPVTIADKETEQSIREELAIAFPGDAIFGEEFGQSGHGDNMWIIDPIDGTRSFVSGLPLFGMLLGYLVAGRPQLGVIRMPALNETYAGAVGLGASCNGARISVSTCAHLATAKLFINEADKLATSEADVFAQLIKAGELRRMSADCYPHALVARGLADAVVDYDLQPYDYLPVSSVVEAAGGVMTDWQGNPLSMSSDGRTITAATPALHAQLLDLVNT
jgi:inositol-phosphate phosphatase/L-galactose 1-phosphate phosphatase/histidinol-phosphatase